MKRLMILTVFAMMLAACQSAPVGPEVRERCRDRPFDAGICIQPSNIRIFTPEGPVRNGEPLF